MALGDICLKRWLFGKVGLIHQTVWSHAWFKADVVLVIGLLLLTAVAVAKNSLWGAELDLFLLVLRCTCQVCRIGAYLYK